MQILLLLMFALVGCSSQQQVGPVGPPGPAGPAGSDSSDTASTILYQKYHKSVFRLTVQCTAVNPYPATCLTGVSAGQVVTFLGSGFLCAANTVCTNTHVANCDQPTPGPNSCFNFTSLLMQATVGTSDTINTGTAPAAPFYTIKDQQSFKFHPTFDVTKIPVNTVPPNAVVSPITTAADVNGLIPNLTKTLAMSFPLGMMDLYTDIGTIINPDIGECDKQGGVSGFGCLSASYAFATSNQEDHGSSGSPIFDVDSGAVIGITTAGSDGANADYTWATDAFHITEF